MFYLAKTAFSAAVAVVLLAAAAGPPPSHALAVPPSSSVLLLVDRRECLSSIFSSAVAVSTADGDDGAAGGAVERRIGTVPAAAATTKPDGPPTAGPWTVTLPLEPCGGGAACVRFTATGSSSAPASASTSTTAGNGRRLLSSRSLLPSAPALPFRVYRAAVDTGSPYLVVSDGGSTGGRGVINSGSLPILLDTNKPMGWGSALLSLVEESLGVFPSGANADAAEAQFAFSESGYGPTEEIYGSRSGKIYWGSAPIRFRDPRLVPAAKSEGESSVAVNNEEPEREREREEREVVLGVLDDELTDESGGSLLGLVKRSNPDTQKVNLRPTFLEQTRLKAPVDPDSDSDNSSQPEGMKDLQIASFRVDYPNRELTLSSGTLIPNDRRAESLPLVDLRPLGDFVEHYACLVESIEFDDGGGASSVVSGASLPGIGGGKGIGDGKGDGKGRSRRRSRDIVAVFDTGLTGCLLTRPFWDDLVDMGMDTNRFSSVDVRIRTLGNHANEAMTSATKTKKKNKGQSAAGDAASTFAFQSSSSTNRLFYVNPIDLDWFDDEETAPHVIVLGQTFLSQGALTIDIDERRALFTTMAEEKPQ